MPRSVSRSASLTRDHTPEAHDDDATGSNDNNAGSTRRARSKTRSKSKRSSKRKRSHTSRNRDHSGTKRRHHHKENQKSKKRHGRRTRSPSTSCSSSSGESTIIDCNTDTDSSSESEDSDMNTYIPLPSAFSSQIGAHLSKKLIKRIRNNTFIDFSDLLPLQQSSALHADELELSVDSKNNPCFIKKQSKKSLSFLMWSEAYDIFQLVYIETHPSKSTKELLILIRELLTYRKHIIDIVKQGGDWLQYDKHFRSEMVKRGDSWSTIRFDLLMTYNFNNKQKVSQKSQGHTTKQKMTNTCYDYNARGKICARLTCPYSHSCAICLLKHPRYMCPTNAPYRRQSAIGSYSNGPSSSMSTPQLHQKTGSSNNLKPSAAPKFDR